MVNIKCSYPKIHKILKLSLTIEQPIYTERVKRLRVKKHKKKKKPVGKLTQRGTLML